MNAQNIEDLICAGKLVGPQGALWDLFSRCSQMQLRLVRSDDLALKYIELSFTDEMGPHAYSQQVKEDQPWQEVLSSVVSTALLRQRKARDGGAE